MDLGDRLPNVLELPWTLTEGDNIVVDGIPQRVLEVRRLRQTLHGESLFAVVHEKSPTGQMLIMTVCPNGIQREWYR